MKVKKQILNVSVGESLREAASSVVRPNRHQMARAWNVGWNAMLQVAIWV